MVRMLLLTLFWSIVGAVFFGVVIIGLPITWSLFVVAAIGVFYLFSEAVYETAENHYMHRNDEELPVEGIPLEQTRSQG